MAYNRLPPLGENHVAPELLKISSMEVQENASEAPFSIIFLHAFGFGKAEGSLRIYLPVKDKKKQHKSAIRGPTLF